MWPNVKNWFTCFAADGVTQGQQVSLLLKSMSGSITKPLTISWLRIRVPYVKMSLFFVVFLNSIYFLLPQTSVQINQAESRRQKCLTFRRLVYWRSDFHSKFKQAICHNAIWCHSRVTEWWFCVRSNFRIVTNDDNKFAQNVRTSKTVKLT